MRLRSALILGSRKTKAPSFVRSSTTLFTAALTSYSVNSLVGRVTAGVAAAGAAAAGEDAAGEAVSFARPLATKNSLAFWMFSVGFLRKASFGDSLLEQLIEQSVFTT